MFQIDQFTPVVSKKPPKFDVFVATMKGATKGEGIDRIPSLVIMPKRNGTMVINLPEKVELPLRGSKGTRLTSVSTRQGFALPNEALSTQLEEIMPPGSVGELHVGDDLAKVVSLISDEEADPNRYEWEIVIFNMIPKPSQKGLPFYERMIHAASLITDCSPKLHLIDMVVEKIPTSESELAKITARALQNYELNIPKLEGLIITHTHAPWCAGKTGKVNNHAYKVVPVQSGEYELIGIEQAKVGKGLKTVPESEWGKLKEEAGALVLANPLNGKSFKVGTGMTKEERCQFWEHRHNILAHPNPLWVEIHYGEIGSKGNPLRPRYIGLRMGPSGDRISLSSLIGEEVTLDQVLI